MADQEGSAENKPAQPKQEGQIINLVVKDQMGSEVHFKVKTHTKLSKVPVLGVCWGCLCVQRRCCMQGSRTHSLQHRAAHQPGAAPQPRCSGLCAGLVS